MFKPNKEELVEASDQKELQTTGPEPEEMLDSVYMEAETPEEEYARARAFIKTEPPVMKIQAYGTELTVKDGPAGVYADGTIILTSENNGCLEEFDKLRINISRHWWDFPGEEIRTKDFFSLWLETYKSQSLNFFTSSDCFTLQQAVDKVLTMRAGILKDVPLDEKPNAKRLSEKNSGDEA